MGSEYLSDPFIANIRPPFAMSSLANPLWSVCVRLRGDSADRFDISLISAPSIGFPVSGFITRAFNSLNRVVHMAKSEQ